MPNNPPLSNIKVRIKSPTLVLNPAPISSVSFVDVNVSGTIYIGNTSVNSTINSTSYSGTSYNSLYLGGVAANNYLTRTGNYTITGIYTHSANLVLNNTGGLVVNGSIGTAGQVLTSNGSTAYWSTTVGYTGSQGSIGYTGSQGVQGSLGYTGSQGSIGYTGSQGSLGYTGSQGSIGYTGSQGIQGLIGYTGSLGPIGYTGSPGIQGVIGYTGSQGVIGYTGSKGDQGVIGYTGSQGVIGYTGSKGDQGTQGPIGYTGSPGTGGGGTPAGSNSQIQFNDSGAFGANIWFTFDKAATLLTIGNSTVNTTANSTSLTVKSIIANGGIGTAGQVLTSNSTGIYWSTAVGYTGSQGIQGVIGYTGSPGIQGVIGYTGSKGDQGVIGYTGSQGTQGPIGYTGSKGDQGVIGYTGSQGIQGPIGYTGSQGVIGYTGSKGDQGTQGPIGYTGSAGTGGSTSPGGSNTYVQFNDSGVFGGVLELSFDKAVNLLTVGNSTVNTTANSTALTVKSIVANGGIGTAGQVLTSNGTLIYWSSPTGGGLSAGDGLTSNSSHYSVLANTGIVANSTGTFVNTSYIDGRVYASDKISSNVAAVSGSDAVFNIVQCSQAEYDAATKDNNTLYVIV